MSDGKIIKVIFFGDIVGKPGRVAVRDFCKTMIPSKIMIL